MYRRKKERSGCLTAWLVASGLFSILALFLLTTILDTPRLSTRVPIFGLVLMFAFLAINIIGVMGAWNWKRWGVYLLVATSLASPIVETILGIAQPSDYIAPVIQIVVLFFLVESRWRDFE